MRNKGDFNKRNTTESNKINKWTSKRPKQKFYKVPRRDQRGPHKNKGG